MSRTYLPILSNCDAFHVNSAGMAILSDLHEWFNLDHDKIGKRKLEGPGEYDPPYSADTERALALGKSIEAINDAQLLDFLYKSVKPNMLFAGTDEEFVGWVRVWEKFLLQSGGYTTGV